MSKYLYLFFIEPNISNATGCHSLGLTSLFQNFPSTVPSASQSSNPSEVLPRSGRDFGKRGPRRHLPQAAEGRTSQEVAGNTKVTNVEMCFVYGLQSEIVVVVIIVTFKLHKHVVVVFEVIAIVVDAVAFVLSNVAIIIMISYSLQDFTLDELGRADGNIEDRIRSELKEREDILEMKKSLAKQATERSRNFINS